MAQLKSTHILGNLAVDGNIVASNIMKNNGTSDNILLGDGSVTSLTTLTTNISSASTAAANAMEKFAEYLPLSGSKITSTTKAEPVMTGPIIFNDCNGIIINSNDSNLNIWSVYGNSGKYE